MLKISESLESLILCAVIRGYTDIKVVNRTELSRQGQFIFDGVSRLVKKKRPPFSATAVLTAASDLAGGDPDILRPYIAKIMDIGGSREAEDILEAVHDKQVLLELVNTVSGQMTTGFNRQALMEKLGTSQGNTLKAVASYFQGKERYLMPEGVPLPDLPCLNKATHGFYGVWALSGDSGVGKSTLTLELAVQVGKHRPVLFYDYENGQAVLLAHLSRAFQGNNKVIRTLTKQIYFRDGIHTLDQDLTSIGKSCLIVVDSLQKIVVRGDEKRAGIEKWVHRLEAMKLLGHCVLMVSEKNRAFYGRTGQAGYKESGEIEYTVDCGLELSEVKGSNGTIVETSLNKNRNWPNKGYVATMTRVNDWWFQETGSPRR
jgi:hypothetical protein